MCEYLVGAIRSARLSSEDSLQVLKDEANRSGYGIQLNEEIPATIRNEIVSAVPSSSSTLLLSVTSDARHNCIEETLSRELEYFGKKEFRAISFFQFLRRLFALAHPDEAHVIYVEGAEVGWSPLEQRKMSLDGFLHLLYEQRDRAGYDVAGVYEITA